MFILYAIPIGLTTGLILGGRVASLANLQFRWAPLAFGGLAAQVVLFADPVATAIGSFGPPLYVASTLAVLAALVRNVRLPGVSPIAVGAAANLAAILTNGGSMPTTAEALERAGRSIGAGYSNSRVLDAPSLAPLTDIFALPAALPLANVFSVGDVLIAVGLVATIAFGMRRPPLASSDVMSPAAGAAPLPGDNSYR